VRRAVLFGLLALVPAAVNASVPAGMTVTAVSCAGRAIAMTVPVRPDVPQEQAPTCCAKGCHARKRGVVARR